MITDLFTKDLATINLGIDMFADDMASQGAHVARMDWTPPGGGDSELVDALRAPVTTFYPGTGMAAGRSSPRSLDADLLALLRHEREAAA